MTVAARLARLRERLAAESVDAMLVTDVSNVRYLTGFVGVFDPEAAALAAVCPDSAVLYTDSRYGEAAQVAADGTQWDVRVATRALHGEALEHLDAAEVTSVAVETSVSHRRFRAIEEAFAGRVRPVDDLVEQLREVKDAEEVASIEAACELGDRAFDHVLGVLAPGMTELDVALEIEVFLRRNGSEGLAFPTIVASGPHSSRPHATVTTRVIERGDPVTMDFGARVGGYCSDMTRTVVVGYVPDGFREIYDVVLGAQSAAREGVRAGLTGIEADRLARDVLAEAGLAEHFGHGLGHGVGLDVHELPSLSTRGERTLRAGSVVTIEPGVYLAGRFGVRIEDSVVLSDAGCRVLTSAPRDLIEL